MKKEPRQRRAENGKYEDHPRMPACFLARFHLVHVGLMAHGSGVRSGAQIWPHAMTDSTLQSSPIAAPAAAPTTVGLHATLAPNPRPAQASEEATLHATEQYSGAEPWEGALETVLASELRGASVPRDVSSH